MKLDSSAAGSGDAFDAVAAGLLKLGARAERQIAILQRRVLDTEVRFSFPAASVDICRRHQALHVFLYRSALFSPSLPLSLSLPIDLPACLPACMLQPMAHA